MTSQKKKNEKIKDYLQLTSIVLTIGIGLCFIFAPWLKNYLVASYSNKYLTKQYAQNEWINNNKESAVFDYESIQPPKTKDIVVKSIAPAPELIIGELTIESLNVNLPIFKGMTNQNLLTGVGTMRSDQEMGIGNYSLAGHHLYNESLLFGPLLKIKEGATIQLNNQKELYTYRVLNTKIVHQSDLSILENQGDNRLTLVTCDVPFQTDQRWVVTAMLVKKDLISWEKGTASSQTVKTYQKVEKQLINQQKQVELSRKKWHLVLCVFLLLMILFLFVILRKKRTVTIKK